MRSDQLQFRIEAAASFVKVLQAIKECDDLHRKAGLPMPELPSFKEESPQDHRQKDLGFEEDDSEDEENIAALPPLPLPRFLIPPDGIPHGWIPVPIQEATVSSIALAYLSDKSAPVTATETADFVRSIQPKAAVNSIYNALNRLAGNGILTRSGDGYKLIRRDEAGMIDGSTLWGPPHSMFPTELTWHRRESVLHALRERRSLRIGEIARLLQEADWMKANVTKDVLKLDIETLLNRGAVKKAPGRKWTLVKSQHETELA